MGEGEGFPFLVFFVMETGAFPLAKNNEWSEQKVSLWEGFLRYVKEEEVFCFESPANLTIVLQ